MLPQSYLELVKNIEYNNLVRLYPLNEINGSVAKDHSSNKKNGTYSGVTLAEQSLNSAIGLANSLKSINNAHGANATEHLSADVTNYPVGTADATDLSSLLTLTGDLLTAYSGHNTDAINATPTYHIAQGTDYPLVSSVTPTTLGEAITRLNDLKEKYRIHQRDTVSHTVGNQNDANLLDATWLGQEPSGENSAKFDGINDIVNISTNISDILASNDITIIVALKPASADKWIHNLNTVNIFEFSSTTTNHQIRLFNRLGNDIRLRFNANGASGGLNLSYPNQTGNEWRTFICRLRSNEPTNNMKIMKDGDVNNEIISTVTFDNLIPTWTLNEAAIGADSDGSGLHWPGWLGFIGIWKSHLSDEKCRMIGKY